MGIIFLSVCSLALKYLKQLSINLFKAHVVQAGTDTSIQCKKDHCVNQVHSISISENLSKSKNICLFYTCVCPPQYQGALELLNI